MPKPETDFPDHMSGKTVPYGHLRVLPSEKQKRVQRHFDSIARRYDLAYILLSIGLYRRWKRICLQKLNLSPGHKLLDLCGGTGDLSRTAVRTGGVLSVVYDLNRPMMTAGRKKTSRRNGLQWVHGNAERLAFSDAAFDRIFVGLGLRNLVRVDNGVAEMFRVLQPEGQLVILEFSLPSAPAMRAVYDTYAFKVMPALGRLVTGARAPFRYLAESVQVFPRPESIRDMMEKTGFANVASQPLSKGLVTLYTAEKPGPYDVPPAGTRRR